MVLLQELEANGIFMVNQILMQMEGLVQIPMDGFLKDEKNGQKRKEPFVIFLRYIQILQRDFVIKLQLKSNSCP